jgi:beta-glucosidase-like glycosyl hydrolase
MCSYNSIQGVPTCGSKGLLTTVLRDLWKWEGFVVVRSYVSY